MDSIELKICELCGMVACILVWYYYDKNTSTELRRVNLSRVGVNIWKEDRDCLLALSIVFNGYYHNWVEIQMLTGSTSLLWQVNKSNPIFSPNST